MAVFFSSSGSGWILSLKVLLASSAVLLMAVLMKTSVPVIADFVVAEVPSAYGLLLSWLRPPYLYVLLNFIIISIVASSKLQRKPEEAEAPLVPPAGAPPTLMVEPVKAPAGVRVEYASYAAVDGPAAWSGAVYSDERSEKVSVSNSEDVFGGAEDGAPDTEAKEVDDDEMEVLRLVTAPERNDSTPTGFSFRNLNEKAEDKKPPASARFPPRKSAGKALGVSKPKRHDTLESTWKAITDGRSMPLTRHLRKSDTWDARPRRNDENTPPSPAPPMKKSETFSDRAGTAVSNTSPSSLSNPSPGSGKLRREPSLSQDELNRRVEAFINKFNEEMKLQRQESLNQYQEMIRRGAA